MPSTPSIQDSSGRVFSVVNRKSQESVSSSRVFAVYNFPSAGLQVSNEKTYVVAQKVGPIFASQAKVFAVVQGRVANNRVRAFPFRLDGHDFVALRLGQTTTLIYDFTTGKWARWSSETDNNVWRPSVGTNWTGMGKKFFDDGVTSDIILGDDTFGLLWGLNAESGVDENPNPDLPVQPYNRKVIGGVAKRMRDTMRNGALYLTADIGAPQTLGASVTLRTSDDTGKTWREQGTIVASPTNNNQEFVWRSLGAISAPGRIFEITDNGATVRLDSLDIR